MDIEKLIERYRQAADKWEKRHPVTDTFDLRVQDALRDAATALSTLQAENEKLRAELEQVKAEKDAAVESIPHECKTCVYHTVFFNGCTLDHDCTNPDGGCSNNYDRWKWRGPHKED